MGASLVDRIDADHASLEIPAERSDSDALVYDRPRRSSEVEQQVVEDDSPEREAPIAIPAIAVNLREPALERRAVRCADAHSRQMRRPRLFDLFEDAHLVENARGLRAHVLGAGFIAGKARAIEDQDLNPGACQVERGRCARGPTPNDYDLCAVPIHNEVVRA